MREICQSVKGPESLCVCVPSDIGIASFETRKEELVSERDLPKC